MDINPNQVTVNDMLNAARAQGILHALSRMDAKLSTLQTGTLHMLSMPDETAQREGVRMAFDGVRMLLEQELSVLQRDYAKELAMAGDAFLRKVG